jgi:hypothetical protein
MWAHQMSEEVFASLLKRWAREVGNRVAALRAELAAKELELTQIRSAMAWMGGTGGEINVAKSLDGGDGSPSNHSETASSALFSSFDTMTLKQLIMSALRVQFPSGATPAQIRDFIHDAYGRKIPLPSLRPQLSRLRADGSLSRDEITRLWRLSSREGLPNGAGAESAETASWEEASERED